MIEAWEVIAMAVFVAVGVAWPTLARCKEEHP
jgi:hypothetical protein